MGVPQNEMAGRLAEQAAMQLRNITAPIVGQPPLPHTVAKGMLRAAIWSQQVDQWMNIMAQHFGCDHLSRIHLGVRSAELFSVGSRRSQTTLARLRFGHVGLNAHLFRFRTTDTSCCACREADETVSHYLLDCPLYDEPRHKMMQSVSYVLPVGIDPTENILLGGPDFQWGPKKYQAVSEAVCEYVEQTSRF